MSAVVDALLTRAGLAEIDAARARGDFEAIWERVELLRTADLLAVGALADRIRAREAGDSVWIHLDRAPAAGDGVVCVTGLAGMDLLRAVAIARITRPRGTRIRIDWNEVGIEIAQVALGFGADELTGRLRPPKQLKKRGLPIASAPQIRRDELAGLIECAQRRPVFVTELEERIDERVVG